MGNGTTQTISGIFNALGNCGAFIDISSTIPGSQATVSKPSGTLNISFGILQDIIATGGASFAANNSIDLGNNQNWTFTSPSPQNLYWVGNSGNWDDGNHWSFVSGGAPSGCSPSPNDNVFFDANSFNITGQNVTINPTTAYCRDMSWQAVSNNPTLTGLTQNQLKIYGSLMFVSGMSINFLADVHFEAISTGKTITLAGKTIRSSVFFNGNGGEWTLQDEFRALGSLWLYRGILNTNNQTVNLNAFVLGSATLNMGSSVFNLANNNGGTGSWTIFSTSAVLNCGTSTINCSGNNIQFGGGNLTYYDLNFTSTSSTFLGLFGNNTFHNVVCSSNISVFHSNIMLNATFLGDAFLNANNTFTNLNFSAGKTYKLKNGTTQIINNHFQIQGSCNNYIFLESTTQGSFATITKPTGSVLGFYIHIKDIHCTGAAVFNAYNSTDLGGNTGWIFHPVGPLLPPSVIIGPTTLCTGATGVVYHISPVAGSISYQWIVPAGATIVSGQGDTTITVNFGTATSGNIVVNSFNGCIYSSTGNTLAVVLANQLTPTVSLTSNHTGTICTGTSVIFTAIATNTGSNIVNYNFKINGISVQNSILSTFTTSTLLNADIATCIITISGGSCYTTTTATSNNITILVNSSTTATPTVAIAASPTGAICTGTSVSFTASTTNIGAGTVTYNFKVNSISVQNNGSNIFSTNTLANGSTIKCDILIAGGACLTSNTASSNAISVAILPILTATIAITASSTNICAGAAITFTANTTNAGSNPIYQWKINGVNTGTNATTFTTNNLNNGDVVSCELNSNASCVSNPILFSNNISIAVNAAPSPTLLVTASDNNVCPNKPIGFIATATNIGSTAIYQWKLNGNNVGINSATYFNNNLSNGDVVKCYVSTINICTLLPIIVNDAVTMIVKPKPIISFNPTSPTIFIGNSVALNASVTGNISTYLWTPPIGLSTTSSANTLANPLQTTTYNLKAISTDNCIANSNLTVKVVTNTFIPNSFTPNGDGKNDVFRIPPTAALINLQYFIVYNRYGNKIFETTDITKGWDGTYKGSKAGNGAYTYMLKAFDNKGEVFLKGTVLLIR